MTSCTLRAEGRESSADDHDATSGRKADTFYALGWIVEGWGIPDAPRVPGLIWHGGVQQGVTTNLYMLQRERTVVAVMANLEGEGLELTKLAAEISDVVLGR